MVRQDRRNNAKTLGGVLLRSRRNLSTKKQRQEDRRGQCLQQSESGTPHRFVNAPQFGTM